MTQAQKTAKDKFKKAIAYRKKTGVSLKEAFAHIYGKKVGAVKKKAAPKKKAVKKVVRKVVKKAAPKKKAAVKKVAKKKLTKLDYDKRFQAKKPGKRTSATGNTYYESRPNRSDRGKLLGIGNLEDKMFKDLYNVRDKIANTKQAILKLQGFKMDVPASERYAYTKKINEYKKYLKEIVTHYKELKKYI
jgi:adenylate kinase